MAAKGKTSRGTERVYLNHAEHKHEQTKAARATCRRIFNETGKPWDGKSLEPRTRGEKAAATRKKNRRLAEQAAGVDALLAASDPMQREAEASVALDRDPEAQTISLPGPVTVGEPLSSPIRDEYGRFTKATLKKWDTLLTHLEGAQDYIKTNGIELTGAALTTTVGGQTFTAIFDGDEWTIEALTEK